MMGGELSVGQLGDQLFSVAERLLSEAIELAQEEDALSWE
jgi:hypothetical protein